MPEAQILVVEDEYIIAKDIEITLTNLGYSVPAIASSGKEAIQKVGKFQPDLVLMDIVLKGSMDGVETADEIRNKFDIPVVYLTAYADDATLQRAKITEPYGYLIKPFQERELHSTIEMALYKQAIEKTLKENKQWLSTTLNSLSEAVIATDKKGIITFMNPEAEWLLGRKFHTSLGKPFDEIVKIINEDTGSEVRKPVEKVIKAGNIIKLAQNCSVKAWDGAEIPVTESGATILDEKENVIGVVFVLQNITERRRTEEALRESEERYRQLVDNFPESMVVISNDMLVYVNPTSIGLLGATSSIEVIGKPILDFIHPDHQHEIIARVREVEDAKKTQKGFKLKIISLDGQVKDVNFSPILISYRGKPAVQAVISDISEPTRLEDILRESEEKYRNLVERSNDGIVIIQDGLLKFANSQISDISGYDIEEVLDTPFTNYIHPDKIGEVKDRYARRMSGKKVTPIYESALLHKNGNRVDVELNAGLTTFQGKPADLVYIRDIRERKTVVNALKESEEKYRSLIETSPDAIIFTDLKGKILMVNKQALQVYGCSSEEEILGKNAFEFISPEDRERAITNAQKTIKTGGIRNVHYKLLKKDGTPYQGEISSSLISDTDSHPKGFIGVVRDISERLQVMDALHDSQEKYYNLFHKSNDSIIIHDLTGRIIDVNQKMVDMFGYKKADVLSSKISKLHPKSALKKSKWAFDQISKDGSVTFEIDFQHRNGETFPAEVSSSIFEIGGKKVIQGIVRDITDRKQAELVLQESEAQLRKVLNSMGEAIHVVDKDFNLKMMNDTFLEWNRDLGLDTDILDKKLFKVFPFLPKKVLDEYKKVQKTGNIIITEEKTKVKDQEFITLTRKIPVFEKGKVNQIITVISDITARKRSEEIIRENEEKYRLLVDNISDGVYTLDDKGYFTFVNKVIEDRAGLTFGQFKKLNFKDIISKKDRKRVIENFNKIMKGESVPPYELDYPTSDGSILTVEVNSKPIYKDGKIIGLQGISRDITARKRIEREILASEEKYRTLFEDFPASITFLDKSGVITYCNKSTEKLTGFTKKQLIGQQFESLLTIDPQDIPKLKKNYLQLLKGKVIKPYELKIIRKDGNHRWIEVAHSLITLDNQVVGFQVIADDITERKHAKEQILMANERLQYLLTSTSAVIYTAKTSGDYGATFISDNVKKVFGYKPSEFTKNSRFWLQRVHPEDAPRIKKEVEILFQRELHSYEYRFKKKDGSYIWVRDEMKLVRDENGEPLEIVGFWVEVTDRISNHDKAGKK